MNSQIMANYHLAILKKPYLDMILSGRKTVETRLTRTRCAPFGQITAGDKVFLKVSSGPVCATAIVTAVEEFENLSQNKVKQLKRKYNHLIRGDEVYWQSKADSKFAVLVWLSDVQTIEPTKIDKKDWRAWVVLTRDIDYGLIG